MKKFRRSRYKRFMDYRKQSIYDNTQLNKLSKFRLMQDKIITKMTKRIRDETI